MGLLPIIGIAILTTCLVAVAALLFEKAIENIRGRRVRAILEDGRVVEAWESGQVNSNISNRYLAFVARYRWVFLFLLIVILFAVVSVVIYGNIGSRAIKPPINVTGASKSAIDTTDTPDSVTNITDKPKPPLPPINGMIGLILSFEVDTSSKDSFAIYPKDEGSFDSIVQITYIPDGFDTVTNNNMSDGFLQKFKRNPYPRFISFIVTFQRGEQRLIRLNTQTKKFE